MNSVLAIDIGGTKMAAGVLNSAGLLSKRVEIPTPKDGSSTELFGVIESLVARVGGVGDLVACGVGCGGPMSDFARLVSPLNIPGWRDFPLRQRVQDLTELRTTVDNDAKAFALGEGWLGAAKGEASYIGMVVSTGVGGGIVLKGRLLEGAAGNAGHIGHVIVNPGAEGPPGQIPGGLEAECSGTSIAFRTGRPAADADLSVRIRTGTLVGRAVASVANLLDLNLAVVGGSVALGYGSVFFEAAQREIDSLCLLDYTRGTRIVPAGNGDRSPLIGAGALAFRAQGLMLGAIKPA